MGSGLPLEGSREDIPRVERKNTSSWSRILVKDSRPWMAAFLDVHSLFRWTVVAADQQKRRDSGRCSRWDLVSGRITSPREAVKHDVKEEKFLNSANQTV